MTITVQRLQRFPVKGMSAEPLDAVEFEASKGVPGDRLYGFARHGSGFDPAAPKPLPKENFVVLVNMARLAGLKSSFDADRQVLRIEIDGRPRTYDVGQNSGRANAAQFLFEWLELNDPEPPQFVSAAPHRFTDVSVYSEQMMQAVSVLNLASVRDLEQRIGTPVDPARFRANIEIDGLPAWAELDAVGARLVGDGLTLTVLKRTQRCAATEVNPATSERDLRIPYLLRKEMGHLDMGIYAEVTTGGRLAVGSELELVA